MPVELICDCCGAKYTLTPSRAKGSRFCSRDCFLKYKTIEDTRTCLQCGKEYHIHLSRKQRSKFNGCCSKECACLYYTREKAPSWKGGGYVSAERKQRFVIRPGQRVANSYIAEHRMIAAAHIGRMLDRDEFMIHIDGNNGNNSPENLFICKTNRDFCAMRDGKVKWPTKSNLDEYK